VNFPASPPSNPFSARSWKEGAILFLFFCASDSTPALIGSALLPQSLFSLTGRFPDVAIEAFFFLVLFTSLQLFSSLLFKSTLSIFLASLNFLSAFPARCSLSR